jgi:hypothetical protein
MGEIAMKVMKLLLFAVLAALAASASADHRWRGRVGVGVYLAPPFYTPWPWYSAPPYWDYPPRVVVVPSSPPPVYVEQRPAPAATESFWYYCAEAKAYYPYVKECPAGWQPVAPQPAQ